LQLISPVIKTMKTLEEVWFQTPYFIRINNLKCNIFRLYLIIPTKNCYHYGKRVAQLMAEMRVNSAVVCEANVPELLPIRICLLKSLQVAFNYCCSK
jgi:hypothetical protein